MSILTLAIRCWVVFVLLSLAPSSVALQGQAQPTQNDDADDDASTLRERLDAERQARLSEMWEKGQVEKDHGGIITQAALQRGRPLAGPVRFEPIRRGVFDQWCDRLEISDTAPVEAIESIWRNYADRINRVLLEKYPPIYEHSSTFAAERAPKSRAAAEALREAMKLFQVARRQVARTEDQMFRALAAVDQGRFAPEVESWQRYRRWERGRDVLHPQLSGSEMHLSRLLEWLEVDWPNAAIQHAYEVEIAPAAERLASYRVNSASELMKIHAAGYFNERDERYEIGSPEAIAAHRESREATQPVLRRQWRHERALYLVNARYLTLLSVLLDTADAERVYDAYTAQAFGSYFPNPYDLRVWFDDLLDDDTVTPRLKGKLSELRQVYMTVQRGIDESLIREIHNQEAELVISRGYGPTDADEPDDQLDYALQRRYDNAVVFAMRLVELLEDDDRFDRVREELEELLGTNLIRTW